LGADEGGSKGSEDEETPTNACKQFNHGANYGKEMESVKPLLTGERLQVAG
jgi:hypothetical protein